VKRAWVMSALLAMRLASAHAQVIGDQLGSHDLGSLRAPVSGGLNNSCLYCHAPHGGGASPSPMWNQQLSVQVYSMYESSTYHQQGVQPSVNSPSKECLSCHDGTVAPGQTIAYGNFQMRGNMKSSSKFGNDLRSSHPFSLRTPFTDAPEINALLFGNPPKTADPQQKIKLIDGNIECTTCHDPHFQGIDHQVPMFLAKDSAQSQMCLACHDPDRVAGNNVNYLGGWENGIHTTAGNATSNNPYVGGYPTVKDSGCNSCHMPHNASGPARLLRGPDEQDCISCHNGTNLDPAIPNVFAEYAKTGHPFPSLPNNTHDRGEPVLLNNNRHATCVDCHNPHAAQQVSGFGLPPAVRGSQASLAGIKASDGITVINPSVNQYENCLRCHGTSVGKANDTLKYGYVQLWLVSAGDPLNVIPQLDSTASSSHPVSHDRGSPYPQPSLLSNMLQVDGATPGRSMGTRIMCTDCHNADDNREFGGTGPNGPHGSKWTHIFERRYEFSQASAPGQLITNLFPQPDLTVNGPYALCGKCHDLRNVVSDASWNQHARHVNNDGFSCSVCHTGHGLGGRNANISGERLVNFDVNVVAPNGNNPVSYSRATNSCTLTCHNHAHSQLGGPMKPLTH